MFPMKMKKKTMNGRSICQGIMLLYTRQFDNAQRAYSSDSISSNNSSISKKILVIKSSSNRVNSCVAIVLVIVVEKIGYK